MTNEELHDELRIAGELAEMANGADEGVTKPSNPKDVIGSRKLPVGLVPDTAVVLMAEAFLEGALKYGRYNWRLAGVRASIYLDAIDRHLKKFRNGQKADRNTHVHHLASVMACCAIMLDADLYGMLNDDRPPCPDEDALADLIDSAEGRVAALKELFKDHDPHQFTIADTRHPPELVASYGGTDANGSPVDEPHIEDAPPSGPQWCEHAGCKRMVVPGFRVCAGHHSRPAL